MKTKTNSFTKVINFCVLALFFISTLIFFTSCDNGNSPNDNINQQQNNNSQTDYCEICDGLQTENCGIKHKCDDENCVEYSDNRIYKNGHTHDYCERTDCDGSTHMGADHPTGPTYPTWFKETPIGGEGSPIKIRYADLIEQPDSGTSAEKNQDRVDQYKKYIKSFTINNELSNVKLDNTVDSFDALIGSTDEDSYYNKNGINDVCAPAIRKFAQNVKLTGDKTLDQTLLKLYYKAFANEVYNYGNNNNCNTTYTTEKDSINKTLENVNKASNSSYSIYNTDGTIHQEAIQNVGQMVLNIAEDLNVEESEVWDVLNLSLTASAIKGTHDYTANSINHTVSDNACSKNEMVDVITEVQLNTTAMISPAKLNKSIFSHDYGRELV